MRQFPDGASDGHLSALGKTFSPASATFTGTN
jgi:hypothetical protein